MELRCGEDGAEILAGLAHGSGDRAAAQHPRQRVHAAVGARRPTLLVGDAVLQSLDITAAPTLRRRAGVLAPLLSRPPRPSPAHLHSPPLAAPPLDHPAAAPPSGGRSRQAARSSGSAAASSSGPDAASRNARPGGRAGAASSPRSIGSSASFS